MTQRERQILQLLLRKLLALLLYKTHILPSL